MKKRVLTWLLALCMAFSLLPVPVMAAQAVSFADVYDRDTSVAVESLRLMGVLDGYSDGRFRPDAQLNRAQFCKMAVYAMAGEEELGLYRTVTVFPDVKPSHWAAPYINMAAKGKTIIAGYPDGRFHPERTVTVGQAVTILLRLLGYKDEHVGGVWPDSYMATGATVGLTDGISASGNAPLTRGQAAKLFLNLLRADTKEGGSYLGGLKDCQVKENMLLMSSTADGPEGRGTALEFSDGSVYSLRGGKASSGILNGQKGTLVLTKNGSRAITFVPDFAGSSKTVILASAKTTQLTDSSGQIYAMTADIPVSGGQGGTWGSACSWLTAGTSLTLYLSDSGEVGHVLVGGGTASSNAAVIVYSKGSSAGFESLTNGVGTYSIVKNGVKASAADLRPYDVATYSGATNSIRVCDTRISVYYESCYPNPKEPTKITALGHEFPVLPTAMESVARFKPGDKMVLLLTEDNQVAGAVEEGRVSGNALGIAKSDGSAELLCGITVSGNAGDNKVAGRLVRVSSSAAGSISMAAVSGGASGELNVNTRKLGGKDLAENVRIFRSEDGTLKPVALSDLNGITPASEVAYGHTDWADRVDVVVIGGSKSGEVVYYGFMNAVTVRDENNWTWYPGYGENGPKKDGVNGEYDKNGNWTWYPGYGDDEPKKDGVNGSYAREDQFTIDTPNGKIGPFDNTYPSANGSCVRVRVRDKTILDLDVLTELRNVPNSAWSGPGAVTVGGRTYTVASDVACYDATSKSWLPSLDTAHAYADASTLYVYDGVVRVVEIHY